MSRKLAHLSDLHIGRSSKTDDAARHLCNAIVESGIDHTVVTGDITHRGSYSSFNRFYEIFRPLQGRMTIVPGNHDLNGEGAGNGIMAETVEIQIVDGLFLVLLNSAGPHNHSIISSHGVLTSETIEQVVQVLGLAPLQSLRVVLLHHHVLPLPVESIGEWFAQSVGWPNAQELTRGSEFLQQVVEHCDLVLHGHRHIAADLSHTNPEGGKILPVYNAGSSTELNGFRVFTHSEGVIERVDWMKSH